MGKVFVGVTALKAFVLQFFDQRNDADVNDLKTQREVVRVDVQLIRIHMSFPFVVEVRGNPW